MRIPVHAEHIKIMTATTKPDNHVFSVTIFITALNMSKNIHAPIDPALRIDQPHV